MPKIFIENFNNSEIVFNNSDKTLIWHIANSGLDWMQACGQKGRCVTCKAFIKNGAENLSPITEAELKFIADGRLKLDERLCCQAELLKDEVILIVPNSTKLPHLKYDF